MRTRFSKWVVLEMPSYSSAAASKGHEAMRLVCWSQLREFAYPPRRIDFVVDRCSRLPLCRVDAEQPCKSEKEPPPLRSIMKQRLHSAGPHQSNDSFWAPQPNTGARLDRLGSVPFPEVAPGNLIFEQNFRRTLCFGSIEENICSLRPARGGIIERCRTPSYRGR